MTPDQSGPDSPLAAVLDSPDVFGRRRTWRNGEFPGLPAELVRGAPAPTFDDRAGMHVRADVRPIRGCTRIDTRLTFEDVFAEFTPFARWRQAAGAAG
jgi:hypothetical protein